MLGYDRETRIVNQGDSAELNALLYDQDDQPIDASTIQSVEFVIRRPDGTLENVPATVDPTDGAARIVYNNTNLEGEYVAVATFTLAGNVIRSTRSDFVVADAFGTINTKAYLDEFYTLTTEDDKLAWQVGYIASRVWQKLEDLFDSTDGGPWMRDMTLNVFSEEKIPEFIEEAIFDINVYNPQTNFDIDKFALPSTDHKVNRNATVLIQGTWVAVIRHLMRTYAEQPTPTGGQVTYEDRRDYLQRWGTIYQIEFQFYDHLVKMWKRQFFDFGHSKLVVGNKAGRLLPAPLRSRNVGRGYY